MKDYTAILRKAISDGLAAIGVYEGAGPPMAYFETLGEDAKRYEYVIFQSEGGDPDKLIAHATTEILEWAQHGMTLVWRRVPEMEQRGNKWISYCRCVQLDDGRREIDIRWRL